MPDPFITSAVNTLQTWKYRREASGKPCDLFAEANRRWPNLSVDYIMVIIKYVETPLYSTHKHRPLE